MAEATEERTLVSGGATHRWLERAWLLLIVSSGLYFLSGNEADNDLWFHVLVGERIVDLGIQRSESLSYTATGGPWVDHEWLSHTVFATLYNHGGDTTLWLMKVVVALITALLLWRTLAPRASSIWVRGGVMVLALAVLARGYAIRPQTFTYLAIAWLFWWLDKREPGEPGAKPSSWPDLALLGVVMVLWVNAHAGFLFGVVVLAVRAATPPWKYFADKLRFALVAFAAIWLNAYGLALFVYVRDELTAIHPLTEWQPVSLTDPHHLPFLFFLALLIVTLPFSRLFRRRPWWAVMVAGVAFMGLQHRRHTPLLALAGAAPLADQLSAALVWLRHRFAFELSAAALRAVVVGLVLLAGVQVFLLFERVRRDGPHIVYQAADYPVGAVDFLRREGIKGNVALPLEWGAYVLWHGTPALAVSLDGRFLTVYSPKIIEDNFAFFRGDGDPADARLLDDYATELVLTPRWVDTPAHHRPDWHVIYRDGVAELLTRGRKRPLVTADAPSGWLRFP